MVIFFVFCIWRIYVLVQSEIQTQNTIIKVENYEPDNVVIHSMVLDLNKDRYSLYLLASHRYSSEISPKRFVHPAIIGSYPYYCYVIFKNENSVNLRYKPNVHVRIYDNGLDELFDYTTKLIQTRKSLDIMGTQSEFSGYHRYHAMHRIGNYGDYGNDLIRKLSYSVKMYQR